MVRKFFSNLFAISLSFMPVQKAIYRLKEKIAQAVIPRTFELFNSNAVGDVENQNPLIAEERGERWRRSTTYRRLAAVRTSTEFTRQRNSELVPPLPHHLTGCPPGKGKRTNP